jgi:hypothetical protein
MKAETTAQTAHTRQPARGLLHRGKDNSNNTNTNTITTPTSNSSSNNNNTNNCFIHSIRA